MELAPDAARCRLHRVQGASTATANCLKTNKSDGMDVSTYSAAARVSTATDMNSFTSARQFAAWLGLTPRQTGTGGKTRQLGISKRGDPYERTMLMHGARAIITRSTQTSWVQRLLQRRPFSVVVAALANKLARTAWAIQVKGKAFDQVRWNPVDVAAA